VEQRRPGVLRGDPAYLSVADTAHARPLVEANRTQHSCGLWRPSPKGPSGCAREPALVGPDTHAFPTPWPFKKRLAHSAKGVSRSARLAGGADRPGEDSSASRVVVWRGAAGRGMATGQARFHGDSVRLIPFVPRPTGGARPTFATTAVEIYGGGQRPSKRLDTWAVPDLSGGVVAPWLRGVVVGVSPRTYWIYRQHFPSASTVLFSHPAYNQTEWLFTQEEVVRMPVIDLENLELASGHRRLSVLKARLVWLQLARTTPRLVERTKAETS
jgi:hypothetical protein